MKQIILLLSILFCYNSNAQQYLVACNKISSKNCVDYIYQKIEVKNAFDFEKKSREFMSLNYSKSPKTLFANGQKCIIVIQYYPKSITGVCKYKMIEFFTGKTLEEARAKYLDIYNKYKNSYEAKPEEIEVFDVFLKK